MAGLRRFLAIALVALAVSGCFSYTTFVTFRNTAPPQTSAASDALEILRVGANIASVLGGGRTSSGSYGQGGSTGRRLVMFARDGDSIGHRDLDRDGIVIPPNVSKARRHATFRL